jgi:hypothetical protein
LKWLEKGWIDYVTPQLYWEIGHNNVDYAVLVDWWSEYTYGRKLYVGLYASGLELNNSRAWRTPNELIRQLSYNHECGQVQGAMFYRARHFLKNVQGLQDSLRRTFYQYPALPPMSSVSKKELFASPRNARIVDGALTSSLLWDKIEEKGGKQVAYYVVYLFPGVGVGDINNPANILAITAENQLDLMNYPLQDGIYTLIVTAVNRFRQESLPSFPVLRRYVQTEKSGL